MFNFGVSELALIFIVALIVIGPKQLPQVARLLGKLAGEAKKTMNEFNSEMDSLSKEVKKQKDDLTSELEDAGKIEGLKSKNTEKENLKKTDELV